MDWEALTPDQKIGIVVDLILNHRLTYSQIAARVGASRSAIAGVVVRARQRGIVLPTAPAPSLPAASGQPKPRKAAPRVPRDTRRAGPGKGSHTAKPGGKRPDFNYKPQFTADADLAPAPPPRDDAFQPLPGSEPVTLVQRLGCAWPVGENPAVFCNEPLKPGSAWCPRHHAIGFIPGSGRPPSLHPAKKLAAPARMTVMTTEWDS